jgi:ferredoxin
MAKKVTVDQEHCIGCGACANLCSKVFNLNDEGKSTVLDDSGAGCDVEVAANSCPVGAIKVTND